MSVEQFEVKGLRVRIEQDAEPESPREWENAGTIVCWHRRYRIGDRHEFREPEDFLEWWEENGEGGTILPVYLFDHSGLRLSTGAFGCPWDSGQVGWAYMTAATQAAELITDPEGCLRSEVEVLDQYLAGDVYGFVIEDAEGNHLDSLWGLYGLEYAEQEARGSAEHLAELATHDFRL